jgi:DNA-directed RNA polymerase specialized sigma24 family protein
MEAGGEELSSEEVCSVLAISDGDQRALLHRGRSGLRQLFEDGFGGCDESPAAW